MTVDLLRIGNPGERLIQDLMVDLEQIFHFSTTMLEDRLDPAGAYNWERQQYHSSELLHQMQAYTTGSGRRLLAITDGDLYIPILTYVFGEAQMDGLCAVVSTHRLRQEFYGLPANDKLLRERLVKEAGHELGHTFSLAHCEDYRCVMASSHSVEWIDVKESMLCASCYAKCLQFRATSGSFRSGRVQAE